MFCDLIKRLWCSESSNTSTPFKTVLFRMLLCLFLLISAVQASVINTVFAPRLRALQNLRPEKSQATELTRDQNNTIIISSTKLTIEPRNPQKAIQAITGKKSPTARYYPEVGPLSVREVIAKETFRLIAQMALDRIPSKYVRSHAKKTKKNVRYWCEKLSPVCLKYKNDKFVEIDGVLATIKRDHKPDFCECNK